MRLILGCLAALILSSPMAGAQTYPTKPIRMIVGFAPGGGVDIAARVLGQKLSELLGQSIVIDNRPGAGGTIANAAAAKADPDGYTLLMTANGPHAIAPSLYPNLQYDVLRDYAPISLVTVNQYVLVVNSSVPAKSVPELIAWIKANPDKATQGNSGIGSPSHVSGILFQKAINSPIQMIPYRGAGDSTQAIVSGQIDVLLNTPAVSMAQLKAGQVKVFAVTDKRRLATAPDIPTTDEAGLPGFYFTFWHAFWVPKGTPKDIVAKLNGALRATLADPEIRKKLTALSQDIFPPDEQTPEALAKFQRAEIDKWWPIIKAAGIKAQ